MTTKFTGNEILELLKCGRECALEDIATPNHPCEKEAYVLKGYLDNIIRYIETGDMYEELHPEKVDSYA